MHRIFLECAYADIEEKFKEHIADMWALKADAADYVNNLEHKQWATYA